MINEITDVLYQLGAEFVITQGEYSLTADAMRMREQRPIYCGDDYVFNFQWVDSDGGPIVITGATITITAKYYPTDAANIVTKTATITDGAQGEFTITLADTDVPGPELITGVYDIQITYVGGSKETILSGDIEFLPNLTA